MIKGQIQWRETLLEGLVEAEQDEKICLLLVYRPSCKICEDILKEFSESQPLIDESYNFVMINIEEDELDPEFKMDGDYCPKIIFFDSEGTYLDRYWNSSLNLPEAKFYYCSAEQVVTTMRLVYNEMLGPQRHKCSPSACRDGWRKSVTLAFCVFAFIAITPALLTLMFPNQILKLDSIQDF